MRLTASLCDSGKLSDAKVKGMGPKPGEYATENTAWGIGKLLATF
jgi:hypothetical protein